MGGEEIATADVNVSANGIAECLFVQELNHDFIAEITLLFGRRQLQFASQAKSTVSSINIPCWKKNNGLLNSRKLNWFVMNWRYEAS